MTMYQSEFTVRYSEKLPIGCQGVTMVDHEGFANIYINPKYDHGHQASAFKHEFSHVENDDAFNDDSLEIIEARAAGTLPGPKQYADEDPLLPEDLSVVARMRAWLLWGILPDDEIWVSFSRAYRTELIKDRCVGRWANRRKKPNPPHLSRLIRRLYAESFAIDTSRK